MAEAADIQTVRQVLSEAGPVASYAAGVIDAVQTIKKALMTQNSQVVVEALQWLEDKADALLEEELAAAQEVSDDE